VLLYAALIINQPYHDFLRPYQVGSSHFSAVSEYYRHIC
jgi:hypothetical protein